MSLTSYRAAPPREATPCRLRRHGDRVDKRAQRVVVMAGRLAGPGGDLLSHVLRRSTMGASGFHGRVRNGVGWGTRAMATRSSNHPFGRDAAEAAQRARRRPALQPGDGQG
jgi:hypothetical protein